MHKVFVKVQVEVNTQGEMRPMLLFWEDERKFEIDKVTEVRRAVSMGAGGSGMRYTCVIHGRPKFLFYEAPRWFLEGK